MIIIINIIIFDDIHRFALGIYKYIVIQIYCNIIVRYRMLHLDANI